MERGYALTIHKAEGLTVDGRWQCPDGTEQAGTVLVHAPGADNPALYVALSRHRDRVVVFGSRAELESPQQEYLDGGPPKTDRLRRVAQQLAEQARSTETSADDRPVLDELGHPRGRTPRTRTTRRRTPRARTDRAGTSRGGRASRRVAGPPGPPPGASPNAPEAAQQQHPGRAIPAPSGQTGGRSGRCPSGRLPSAAQAADTTTTHAASAAWGWSGEGPLARPGRDEVER